MTNYGDSMKLMPKDDVNDKPEDIKTADEFEDDLMDDDEETIEIPEEIAQLLKDNEQFQLVQDTKGFASCFPEWDLYPVINSNR